MSESKIIDAGVDVKILGPEDVDPELLKNGQTTKITINGVEYDPENIPEEYRSQVRELVKNKYKLTSDAKQSLDSSPQIKKVERGLYVLVQFFSILNGFVVRGIVGSFVVSQSVVLSPFATLIVSIVSGQLAYMLAKLNMRKNKFILDRVNNGVVSYFFERFSGILITFRAGSYAVIVNLIVYGVVVAVLSGRI